MSQGSYIDPMDRINVAVAGGHTAFAGSAGGGGGAWTVKQEVVRSPREELLEDGKQIIAGDRDMDYGPPTDNFERIAGQLTALGYKAPDGGDIKPHDVAVIHIVTKTARIVWMPGKRDNWLDIAGYTGCGWECVVNDTDTGGQ